MVSRASRAGRQRAQGTSMLRMWRRTSVARCVALRPSSEPRVTAEERSSPLLVAATCRSTSARVAAVSRSSPRVTSAIQARTFARRAARRLVGIGTPTPRRRFGFSAPQRCADSGSAGAVLRGVAVRTLDPPGSAVDAVRGRPTFEQVPQEHREGGYCGNDGDAQAIPTPAPAARFALLFDAFRAEELVD